MDRAAKVKVYRKASVKRKRRQKERQYGVWAGVLAVGMAFVLILALRGWKEQAEMSHVTYAELASLMSAFIDDDTEQAYYKDAAKIVTASDMKDLVQKTGLSGVIAVEGGSGGLDRDSLMAYYAEILDYLDLDGQVEKKTVLFLKDEGQSWLTNLGELRENPGIAQPEPYSVYETYILKDVMLGVCSESEESVKIKKVTVQDVSDKELCFLYGDGEFTMKLRAGAGDVEKNAVCTLTVEGGEIARVQQESQLAERSAAAEGETTEKDVRVLLLNGGDIHYGQVYLGCSGEYVVHKNHTKKEKYGKSDILNIKKLKLKNGQYAVVAPEKSGGKLFLTDKDGTAQSKGYYGSFTVYRDKEGYYIVNKVNIERYLYSVVASEMPASFAPEALKAQAVCARSYVYRQMEAGDYSDYHAHIDDSTNYQVYNKSDLNDACTNAVKETAGIVMYDGDGEIVNAYYFSSSCGYSSGMEIWNQEGQCPYLQAKSLVKGEKTFDLSGEKAFRAYISQTDVAAYDSHSKYFRWTARLETSGSLKQIRQQIQARRQINEKNINYYIRTGGKTKRTDSMKGFGGITDISCTKRDKSGAMLELTIAFEYGTVKVKSEYNIRSILGCAMEKITYMDGSENTSAQFLPSVYASVSFDKKSGRYLLAGGGNGHGMGMSQYGADGMAAAGWSYKKILKFYYTGIRTGKVS